MILYNISVFLWLVIAICVLYTLYKAYIKIKYPFWSTQPIFHYHYIWYWLFPNKVIHKIPPKINKYVDLQKIKIISVYDIQQQQLQDICDFIKNNYLQTLHYSYNPTKIDIVQYLHGSHHTSYFCVYKNPCSSDITGVTTTRALDVKLPNDKIIPTYYVDHLCVSKHFRKKNIAAKLIQTFYYVMSRQNKKVLTYFFKKEGSLMNFVPLTKYTTYGYKANTITSLYDTKLNNIHSHEIKQVDTTYIADVWHFIKKNQSRYKIAVIPSFSMFKNIVEHKLYYVYFQTKNRKIQNLYIIKNSATTYYDDPCIEVIASMCLKKNTTYIQGFIKSIDMCCCYFSAKNIFIEDIGDTTFFIEYIKKARSAKSIFTESPTAYYFYNYAIRPIHANRCFILT